MALGLAPATANSMLAALCSNTSYVNSAVWIKLHTADPGVAGATAAAVHTTRMQADFGTAASGAIATDAALTWTTVAGTEDYTHFSAWTLVTAGVFLFSGLITANAVTAGDTFTIPSGGLTATFAVAA